MEQSEKMRRCETLDAMLSRFVQWLSAFGELSQDQYDFWANPAGGKAKAVYYRHRWGALAVAPFVLLDSFLPATRAWFWPKTRFPIADAHYAMGFLNLYRATGNEAYRQRASSFLESLEASRCPGWKNYCWGYPFDWVTVGSGVTTSQTPLITTTPYVYEAFLAAAELDCDERRLQILESIAEHAFRDIHDTPLAPYGMGGSYTPEAQDQSHIVNAASYRAFLLTDAGKRFSRPEYSEAAERNTHFVAACQNSDGSWYYAADGTQNFIDNFHTCFVLKNLAKIEALTGNPECTRAIDRGLRFYMDHLLDGQNLPVPFAAAPRLTVHKRELYDYAECVNLCLLLQDRSPRCGEVLPALLADLHGRWQKPDGSFRTRRMIAGWNNVPYHRWAQSQMFRSLSLWLLSELGDAPAHALQGKR